jgi:tol-pal system protein YbgF
MDVNMDMLRRVRRRTLATLIAALWVVPAMAQPLSDDAAARLLQRLDDLEHDVSTLRGENERLRNDLTDIQKSQQEQADKPKPDSMSGSASSSTSSSTPTDVKTPDPAAKTDPNSYYSYGTNKSDDKNLGAKPADAPSDKPADKPLDATSSSTASGISAASGTSSTPSSTSGSTALPKTEERAAYDDAFQLLLKSPKEALPAFRSFLKDYPSSSLASSAQYWVGEALYSEKDFKPASDEFLVVLKDYKGSEKAPDAALKLGYCFYELKDWEKARKTLEDVIKFFPGKDAEKLAKDRLDKMKLEGH